MIFVAKDDDIFSPFKTVNYRFKEPVEPPEIKQFFTLEPKTGKVILNENLELFPQRNFTVSFIFYCSIGHFSELFAIFFMILVLFVLELYILESDQL